MFVETHEGGWIDARIVTIIQPQVSSKNGPFVDVDTSDPRGLKLSFPFASKEEAKAWAKGFAERCNQALASSGTVY